MCLSGDHEEPVAARVQWQQGHGNSLRSQEGNGSCCNCSHPRKQRQPLGQHGDEAGVMKQILPVLFLSCFYPYPLLLLRTALRTLLTCLSTHPPSSVAFWVSRRLCDRQVTTLHRKGNDVHKEAGFETPTTEGTWAKG